MRTKTRSRRRPQLRRFELRLAYGQFYYLDRIPQLERALARQPRTLQLDLVGTSEIPADLALLLRAVLLARSPRTRLVTHARSSLHNGAVLVWLLGEERRIREDACLFFRRANLPENAEARENEPWRGEEAAYADSDSELDPDEGHHARMLQAINEYLPVSELAGRFIGLPVLRQFGLVENEPVDNFLASAFAKSDPALNPR